MILINHFLFKSPSQLSDKEGGYKTLFIHRENFFCFYRCTILLNLSISLIYLLCRRLKPHTNVIQYYGICCDPSFPTCIVTGIPIYSIYLSILSALSFGSAYLLSFFLSFLSNSVYANLHRIYVPRIIAALPGFPRE